MEETVRTELRRGDPKISIGDISRRNNKLSFMVRDGSQVDAAVERIRSLTQGAGMSGQPDWNRTDERRVGKECVSTCRSRWPPYPSTKTQSNILSTVLNHN